VCKYQVVYKEMSYVYGVCIGEAVLLAAHAVHPASTDLDKLFCMSCSSNVTGRHYNYYWQVQQVPQMLETAC
jgi:hypothetical protein